ncbi:alpha/beta fold hydrolase [Actinomadura kijaniata]|uniref:alpha/beta fold hydrolase n=1 Tax=Actinomadura kijaniata TaxID=46161 RepID=UPI003F1C7840
MVIVPGLGALGYLMDMLSGCAGWTRSFLLDVPGFGHRPPRPCPAEIGSMAGTVAAWLEVVAEDEPVVLVGHSTGAQVVLQVAARRSERVQALVLMGPTFPPEQRRVLGLLRGCVGALRRESPRLLPVTVPYYVRGGYRQMARLLRSAWRDAPERTIANVSCPVLLVRGERDVFAPQAWVDQLAATAPDGRSVTVPGAHNFPFRRGELAGALVAQAARRADLIG